MSRARIVDDTLSILMQVRVEERQGGCRGGTKAKTGRPRDKSVRKPAFLFLFPTPVASPLPPQPTLNSAVDHLRIRIKD
jgi:hypothetical protein